MPAGRRGARADVSEPQAEPGPPATAAAQGLVLRNVGFLFVAQLAATPLSVLVNVVAARSLGPDDFGQIYLATTFSAFAFLFVEWGQGATLTAMIARDRAHAGTILGSGLAWRAAALPAVALVLFAGCWLLAYDRSFLRVLALVMLASAFGTVSLACVDVFRGFERSDFSARAYVAWQFLTAMVVVPTLLLGGRLDAYLLAQVACAAIGALALLRCLPPIGVHPLAVRRSAMRALATAGSSFLVFNIVIALQTNVDAVFLSRLATPDAIGWNAVARKLVGVLIFPASAIIGALYPTLCRLHGTDPLAFAGTARAALRATLIGAVPLALGCALYPGIGIGLFGPLAYGPAQDNLRVLAIFVLLVYGSMPIGSTLAAAGRQRAWALVQLACVIVSAVADPLLIPWFQRSVGNGGLGVCVSTAASEVLMVAAGIWLLPRGIIDRSLVRALALVLAAGLAMVAASVLLSRLNPYPAAALALCAYGATLWATGAVDRRQIATMRAMLAGRGRA